VNPIANAGAFSRPVRMGRLKVSERLQVPDDHMRVSIETAERCYRNWSKVR
jgi:hypothetical protein